MCNNIGINREGSSIKELVMHMVKPWWASNECIAANITIAVTIVNRACNNDVYYKLDVLNTS